MATVDQTSTTPLQPDLFGPDYDADFQPEVALKSPESEYLYLNILAWEDYYLEFEERFGNKPVLEQLREAKIPKVLVPDTLWADGLLMCYQKWIYLDGRHSDEYLTEVAAHEFGHALAALAEEGVLDRTRGPRDRFRRQFELSLETEDRNRCIIPTGQLAHNDTQEPWCDLMIPRWLYQDDRYDQLLSIVKKAREQGELIID